MEKYHQGLYDDDIEYPPNNQLLLQPTTPSSLYSSIFLPLLFLTFFLLFGFKASRTLINEPSSSSSNLHTQTPSCKSFTSLSVKVTISPLFSLQAIACETSIYQRALRAPFGPYCRGLAIFPRSSQPPRCRQGAPAHLPHSLPRVRQTFCQSRPRWLHDRERDARLELRGRRHRGCVVFTVHIHEPLQRLPYDVFH